MTDMLALVLGYGDQEAALRAVLTQHGLRVRIVNPDEMHETIGYLCGLPGFSAAQSHPAGAVSPMLVFYGLPGDQLHPLLAAIREAGITVQSLKAVVTPTNAGWTLAALLQELRQEQQVMQGLMRLKKLRDGIPMPGPENFRLMKALMQAEMLLRGDREVTPEEVETAYRELAAAAGR